VRPYTSCMSAHTGTTLHTTDFAPFIPAHQGRPVELNLVSLGLQPSKPSTKDSIIACAFMLGYIAVYIAVGFAAVSAIGWAWTAAFG
jgi:hypothetical protein